MFCDSDPVGSCYCSVYTSSQALVTNLPIPAGANVTVRVRPAPGALPDGDAIDKVKTVALGPAAGPAGFCRQVVIPSSVVRNALDNPQAYEGFGRCRNEGLPCSLYNGPRNHLSLRNPAAPYDPRFNPPVWRAGCP
jgi:hypothetical protein